MRFQSLLLVIATLVMLSTSCRNNIHEKENWASFFQKRGIDSASFEVLDKTHEQIFYYNLDRTSRRFAPASTFKIMHSLIALESNLAPDIDYLIPWDGMKRWNENWNQNLTMEQAFKYSASPYYQALAKKLGRETMQKYIDSVQYGNMIIGDSIDEFWIDGSLKVTPDEQVKFLKMLYFDKLPFSKRSQRLVRSLMLQEKNNDYKLSYKTGTNTTETGYLCHLVGYLEKVETQLGVETKKEETNYRPYFFAMNFETKTKDVDLSELIKMRVEITKEIFKDLEVIE